MTSFNYRVCNKVYKSGVVDGKGFSNSTWKLIMDNCLNLGDK